MCPLRVGKSWKNKLLFFPEPTTTFSVMSVGEYKLDCKALWDIPG